MHNFTGDVTAAQTKELKNVFNLFSKAQTNIANLLSEQQENMTEMLDYVNEAVSQQQGQLQYLTNPTRYDQHFSLATMYTPAGAVWKNMFPVGNWEYDQTSDSFWQMSNVALMATDSNQKTTADKAPNNSIFTEWLTRSAAYEIECEITLYNLS